MNEKLEDTPLKVSEIIALIKGCLDAYADHMDLGFFDPFQREDRQMRQLRYWKKNLEALLKKNGDREMNWLDLDYCIFYWGWRWVWTTYPDFIYLPLNVIQNAVEDDGGTPVLEWEKKYLSFMKAANKSFLFRCQKNLVFCSTNNFIKRTKCLAILSDGALLTQNFEKLEKELGTDNRVIRWGDLCLILEILSQQGLLNQGNLDVLLKKNRHLPSYLLDACSQEGFFNQEIFNQVMRYNTVFDSLEIQNKILSSSREGTVTRRQFDRMVSCCDQYSKDVEREEHVKSLLYTNKLSGIYSCVELLSSLNFLPYGSWLRLKSSELPTKGEMSEQGKYPPTVVFLKISLFKGGGYKFYIYGLSEERQARFTELDFGWWRRYIPPTLSKIRQIARNEYDMVFSGSYWTKTKLLNGHHPYQMVDCLLPYSDILYEVRLEFEKMMEEGPLNKNFMDQVISLCQQLDQNVDPKEARRVVGTYIYKYWLTSKANNPCTVQLEDSHTAVLYSVREYLDRIPDYGQTKDFWQQIITCCTQHEGNDAACQQAVIAMINARLAALVRGGTREGQINYGQSTHNKYVHRSVSHSVMQLAGSGTGVKLIMQGEEPNLDLLNGCEVPALIKWECGDTDLFYVYGKTADEQSILISLGTSDLLQAIDFNSETLWVSRYENSDIFQYLHENDLVPKGYSKMVCPEEMNKWVEELGTEKVISEMLNEKIGLLNVSPDEKKTMRAKLIRQQELAKKGFLQLSRSNYFDEDSKIDTKEMLRLVWAAIHDDKRRNGTLENAKRLLAEGLYEIQREYGLNAEGEEINESARDNSTCSRGAFNKILEKLCSIHPRVAIIFITKETFTLKLSQVAREEAIKYLTENPRMGGNVKQHGSLLPIAGNIKERIAQRMWAEFGETLFQDDRVGFNREIDTIGHTGVEEDFWEKNPRCLVEDKLVVAHGETKILVSYLVDIAINGSGETLKLKVDLNKDGLDLMGEINASMESLPEQRKDVICLGKKYTNTPEGNTSFINALKTKCDMGINTFNILIMKKATEQTEQKEKPCYGAPFSTVPTVQTREKKKGKEREEYAIPTNNLT